LICDRHTAAAPPPATCASPQSLLPRFVDARLPGLGASERAALLGMLGQSDLDAHAFESKLRLLINDAVFLEASASS